MNKQKHTFPTTWPLRHPYAFGTLMVFLMLFGKLPMSPLAMKLGGFDTTAPVLKIGIMAVLLSFILLPVETLIGQAFPVWIMRRFRIRNILALAAGAGLAFGLLHLSIGAGAVVLMIVPGIVLGICWLAWRPRSFLYTLVATTLVHAVHNAIAFTFYVYFSG